MRQKQILRVVVGFLSLSVALFSSGLAYAQTYTSPSYQVDEIFIGSGGSNDVSSTSYRARASIGDLGIGNSSSTNYQAYGGFTTTTAPELEFVVDEINVDLGTLSTGSAATTSTTFRVRTYLAQGYTIYTEGNPPTSEGGSVLDALTSGGTSSPGNEQFGINLVDNSSPNVGADPVQLPDASFSFGSVAAGYGTVNTFRYNSGEAIAQSTKSSGVTEFTVSYLYNVDELTPAGLYTFRQSLVAVSTF